MLKLTNVYRVFPWLESAEVNEPGHPLYVGVPQGRGRIDNPDSYLSLYVSETAEGAIGEAFGNHARWTSDLLEGLPILPGSSRAIARIDASDLVVVDLDDPETLLEHQIRPSRVVTRDRSVTQGWALKILNKRIADGIRWWSFHNPDWGSLGIWNRDRLRVLDVVPLSSRLELVERVAAEMFRVWEP